MSRLRITGLVRAMRYVRRRLEAGIPPDAADAFRLYLRDIVATVERICREHRTRPSELPRPSRAAYDYLAGLAASGDLPPPTGRAASPRPLSVPNVVRTNTALLTAISEQVRERSAAEVAAEWGERAEAAARRIEAACRERGCTPADLPLPSRRAYALLAFLALDDVLVRYAETVAALHGICEPILFPSASAKARLHVRLDDQTGVYRYRRRGEHWVMRLNPGFLSADEEMLRLVAAEAFEGKRKDRRGILHEFVHSEEFIGIGQELADLVARDAETKGAVYDLAEVCEKVRRRHFSPPADPPSSLAWTESPTFRTFGHFDSLRDRITISRSLDDRNVPRYVVEFVMYHELLHRVHGIGWATSRRAMHTSAFRADERKFPRYERAQEFLNRFAVRLRRRLK